MEAIRGRWAVTALDPKHDKKSIDHMNESIGYYLLEKPTKAEPYYIVGYLNFTGELSEGSEWATEEEVARLTALEEKIYKIR